MMHHPKVHTTSSMVDDSNLNNDPSQMGYYPSASGYSKGQNLPPRSAYDYGQHTHSLMQSQHPQHPVFNRQTQMMDQSMLSGPLQYPADIQGQESSNMDAGNSMSGVGLPSYYNQIGNDDSQSDNILSQVSQSRMPDSADDQPYNPFQTATVALSGDGSPKSLSLTDDSTKDTKKRKVESPHERDLSTSPKKTSSGPKKFICDQFEDCHAEFQRKEHLERHIRKHTGEKPFQCPCGKTFTRRDNLRQHGQSVHGKENQPPAFWIAFDEQCAPSTRQPGKRNSVSRRTKKGHARGQSTSSIASTMSSISSYSSLTSPGQWPSHRPNSLSGPLNYLDQMSQAGDIYMEGRPESAHSYTGSVLGGPIPTFSANMSARYPARPMSLNMGGDYTTDPIRPMGPGAARRTSLISNSDSRNSVYGMFEQQGYRPGTGNSIAASTYSQEMSYPRRSSFVQAQGMPMHDGMMQRPMSGIAPQPMFRSAMPQPQDQSIPENAATNAHMFGRQRRDSQQLPGIDTFSRAAESGEYRRPPSSNILSSSPTSSQFPVQQQMSMQGIPNMMNRNVMSSPARPDVFARPFPDSVESTPQRRVVPPTSGRVALPSIVQMSIPNRDNQVTPTQKTQRSDLPLISESPRTSSGNWARDASASLSNIVGGEERTGVPGQNLNLMRSGQALMQSTGMQPPPVPEQNTSQGMGQTQTQGQEGATSSTGRPGETGTLNMLLQAAQAQEKK